MRVHIISATLLFGTLLSSCSSAVPADIRPEVARPLNEARVLANAGSDKAAIMAKLNKAAAVSNLNSDERQQIRSTGEYALARAGRVSGGPPGASDAQMGRQLPPDYSQTLGYTGLR
jgi:hypothetical protein